MVGIMTVAGSQASGLRIAATGQASEAADPTRRAGTLSLSHGLPSSWRAR